MVTPDGPVRSVKLLRAWLEGMERAGEAASALFQDKSQHIGKEADAIAEFGLENVCGRFYRSATKSCVMVRGACVGFCRGESVKAWRRIHPVFPKRRLRNRFVNKRGIDRCPYPFPMICFKSRSFGRGAFVEITVCKQPCP